MRIGCAPVATWCDLVSKCAGQCIYILLYASIELRTSEIIHPITQLAGLRSVPHVYVTIYKDEKDYR